MLQLLDLVCSPLSSRLYQRASKQQLNERDSASLVIYGLKKSKDEFFKMRELFDVCDCAEAMVRVARLGKPPRRDEKTSLRPLKVELWSLNDRD